MPEEPRDVKHLREAWEAYESGGYQGLVELGRKRNEDHPKEQDENQQQPEQE